MRKRVIYAHSPQWQDVVRRADALMKSPAFRAVKSEGRTLAGFLECPDGTRGFLRRSQVRSFIAGLFGRTAGSRAARSVRAAALLTRAGFLCPQPLGAMEVLRAGALRESYLLSEAVENGQTLSVFTLGRTGERRADYRRRKAVSDVLAAELRRLHDSGLYTTDLQETNVMLAERDGRLRIYFLDLEDFRRTWTVGWKLRMLNLVQLDRSIGRFICRAGRLRFLYAYADGELGERGARRALVASYLRLRQSVDRKHRRRNRGATPIAGEACA